MCIDDIVGGVDDRVKRQRQRLRRRTAGRRSLNTADKVVEVVVGGVGPVDALRAAQQVDRRRLSLGKVPVRPLHVENRRLGHRRVDATLEDAAAH